MIHSNFTCQRWLTSWKLNLCLISCFLLENITNLWKLWGKVYMTVHKVLKKKRWITENPHFNDVEVLLKQSHLWEKLNSLAAQF